MQNNIKIVTIFSINEVTSKKRKTYITIISITVIYSNRMTSIMFSPLKPQVWFKKVTTRRFATNYRKTDLQNYIRHTNQFPLLVTKRTYIHTHFFGDATYLAAIKRIDWQKRTSNGKSEAENLWCTISCQPTFSLRTKLKHTYLQMQTLREMTAEIFLCLRLYKHETREIMTWQTSARECVGKLHFVVRKENMTLYYFCRKILKIKKIMSRVGLDPGTSTSQQRYVTSKLSEVD